MSKIRHWDEATQSWVIDSASNAMNIELSNPGYTDQNGESISVDEGFTKVDNRITKLEHNLAWIYQNGAKGGGGGGGGGGGTIDTTSYNIVIDEGNRVYTSGTSVTIHVTITGGSVRKTFSMVITDSNGNTKGTYVVTSLTLTEITINNLNDATSRLTINANSGLNYATPTTFTVIAGAIKLSLSMVPNTTIYPQNPVGQVILNALNSTDSDLAIIVNCNGSLLDEFEIPKAKDSQFIVESIVNFLNEAKTNAIGETFVFEIYARGVLNDNVLQSNSITFSCTIVLPNTLYILTYDVDKRVPTSNADLSDLTRYVYGNSIQFTYQLTYSRVAFSYYNIYYTVTPCYFVDGVLLSDESKMIQGTISRVAKDINQLFLFNTSSLPDDIILDNYKFVKITLHAVSVDSDTIEDYKTLYVTLSEAATKYITATNFNRSLIAYFSPVMGVPVGNTTTWQYDNRNTRFPYNPLGTVQLRYINLIGHNLNYFMTLTDMQGAHLAGNSWADLGINLFSGDATEVNLFNGSGWALSFTFRTDANVDASDVVASLGKWRNGELTAGIEIRADKVIYAVQTTLYTLNITKGDLTTVDIVGERYVGPGDTETNPTHWFIKTYLNGVLSHITSHTSSEIFNTNNNGTYGWYFDELLHIGGRVINNEITDAASVHLYDLKAYSTALSDNEIIQNYISAYLYSELVPNSNPDMSTLNELLQKNFIQIGTDGNYHSMLFQDDDETQYKDATSLLNSLVSALAESRIPYPIVVINQIDSDSNFLGITESKFNEDLKETVMASRFTINMDYYTMGNQTPVRIENTAGTRMRIGIQGTSSLRYNSKNYEIYMGEDDEGKDVLVQMKEDWLPENRFTLKADVMDSSHVNNVLIGRIINGLVTTQDSQGNEVAIKPLDNTPPMSLNGYLWANKVKHTSEGFPCILFINFKASGSNVSNARCMGIYNFNLGRYAYFNLGLKLLNSVTFKDTTETYPRMVESYTEGLEIEQGSPVYSMEVQENSTIAMFDQDDPNILQEGVFEFPYDSDGQGMTNLGKLLTFLASFGYNIESDRKVYIDNDWKTPRLAKIEGTWQESGRYYSSFDPVNYVKSTLDLHMNWNNMVSYYIIAIVFGLVDSMAKNLTLRSWNKSSSGDNIWYMCFYDMDTALRVNNVGAETVPYNAHLHRYYTDTSSIAEARVTNHCASISGLFNLEYSGYNTRLQEIVENINVGYDSANAKTLQSVYRQLRTNLFPDPAEFIDKYYGGQIGQVGSALYNYDYYLKYLLVEKTFNPATGQYGDNTYNYSEISYLHGNGSTNVKDWFVKRIKFLDGVYGMNGKVNGLEGITNTPLAQGWMDNNATYITNLSPSSVQLTLQAESLIRVTIATSGEANSFWIDETARDYRVNNVGARQVVTIYANNYLTLLGKFNSFTWDTLGSLTFPLIKELSLRDLKNIRSDNFLRNTNNLQSLVKLDLHGVTLLDSNSNPVYQPLAIALLLPNLEELDVSDSTFNEVPLSSSSVLRTLDLSNTKIKTLTYSNQPMLEEIKIDGCIELENINISDCPKLKKIVVPQSVKTVYIGNCENLEELEAPYTGSTDKTSLLTLLTVSACPNLKKVTLEGLNNKVNCEISLIGASGIEDLNIRGLNVKSIIFAPKDTWTSLKSLNMSACFESNLNYYGSTLGYRDPLDLTTHPNLQKLSCQDNQAITSVKCPNIDGHYIELDAGAFAGCVHLERIYGNFLITGSRVFDTCTALILNDETTYNSYPLTSYPVPYVPGDKVCNIKISDTLTSTAEMFSNCPEISGNDFTMIMMLLTDSITNMNKMFLGCRKVDAIIRYDVFRHCPNVTDLTAFAAGSGLKGGIYSRDDNYSESDSTTWGTFDFIRGIKSLTEAFANSDLLFIDADIFAPWKDGYIDTYFNIQDADRMFLGCTLLVSYLKASSGRTIGGNLQSKTFFTNLRSLNNFPKDMFSGCKYVKMDINTREVNGLVHDYLFHFPWKINIQVLNSEIYSGIELVGQIHANVFGGITKQIDNDSVIVDFVTIDGPFSASSGVTCRLSLMGNMLRALGPTLILAKNVLKGLSFELEVNNYNLDGRSVKAHIIDSVIPNDLFQGCTRLTNISGFFANPNITNEYKVLENPNDPETTQSNIFEFPTNGMFNDCTSLENVSDLFEDAHFLNIKLVGGGFANCPIRNVSEMFKGSGVFGMIPYKLFYTLNQTIDNISKVFDSTYKLGYSVDRSVDTTSYYFILNPDGTYKEMQVTFEDKVISNLGHTIPFLLDFTNFDGSDEWYIDGRDWADINPDLANTTTYQKLNDTVFKYDRALKQALSDSRDRETGYLNYIFPADYFKYCSPTCSMDEAFAGLSYKTKDLVSTDYGRTLVDGAMQGLIGRLPCKLFSNNINNTKFNSVFKDLNYCAFVNFDSYKLNVLGESASNCRGIKFPPDLLVNNVRLTDISNLFYGLYVETGVDINENLLTYNIALTNVSGLFRNITLSEYDYYGMTNGNNPLIPISNLFITCTELQNVSNLFAVDDPEANDKGLRIVNTSLFPNVERNGVMVPANSRITNISGMFYNNRRLTGSIPLFDLGSYPRITMYSNYVEGVNKANITNAEVFIGTHPDSWVPQTWRTD